MPFYMDGFHNLEFLRQSLQIVVVTISTCTYHSSHTFRMTCALVSKYRYLRVLRHWEGSGVVDCELWTLSCSWHHHYQIFIFQNMRHKKWISDNDDVMSMREFKVHSLQHHSPPSVLRHVGSDIWRPMHMSSWTCDSSGRCRLRLWGGVVSIGSVKVSGFQSVNRHSVLPTINVRREKLFSSFQHWIRSIIGWL